MYCSVRNSVETGDLLAWDKSPSGTESIWIKLVRFFTVSDYGHVSVAWREDGVLYHVEAVMPYIRKAVVPLDQNFYLIPLADKLQSPVGMEFFDDKIGNRYSVLDAIRAYFGVVTKHDNRWQCAELVAEFYKEQGLDLEPRSMTPAHVVRSAMKWGDMKLTSSKSMIS